MAKPDLTLRESWEVECSSRRKVLMLTSGHANGDGRLSLVDVNDQCGRHEVVATGASINNGCAVR